MSSVALYRVERSTELVHHGIKGQKWGRRRYQNPDGSYTAAGKARYGIDGSFARNYLDTRGEHLNRAQQSIANGITRERRVTASMRNASIATAKRSLKKTRGSAPRAITRTAIGFVGKQIAVNITSVSAGLGVAMLTNNDDLGRAVGMGVQAVGSLWNIADTATRVGYIAGDAYRRNQKPHRA